jgi:hypothetical protein
MAGKIVELFEQVQKIPYQVSQYNEEVIDHSLEKGDCRHKHFLLKKLLQQEGFEVKETKVVFDWKDISIPTEILGILKAGTVWDHDSLQVNVDGRWIRVDCTWNPELKGKGFPVTENWDGVSDTMQVTNGKLEFFDKSKYEKDPKKIIIVKEQAYAFAEKLNRFLSE